MVAALLPVLYWLHRRWPIGGGAAQHRDPCAAAACPSASSIRCGMAALRLLWFTGILGEALQLPAHASTGWPTSSPRMSSPTRMLSGGVLVLRHLLRAS